MRNVGGERVPMEITRRVPVDELSKVFDYDGNEVLLGSGTYANVFLRQFQGRDFVAEKVFKQPDPNGE